MILGRNRHMPFDQKLTLGQMRQSGPRRLHVSCGNPNCSHTVVIDAECWPGSLRLSDLEVLYVCRACGHRGAEVRPDRHGAGPRLEFSGR